MCFDLCFRSLAPSTEEEYNKGWKFCQCLQTGSFKEDKGIFTVDLPLYEIFLTGQDTDQGRCSGLCPHTDKLILTVKCTLYIRCCILYLNQLL